MSSTTLAATREVNTPLAAYFIGNSLTWDTLGAKPNEFVSFNVLVRQASYKFDPIGYHILCGSSLDNIANNPRETCIEPEDGVGTLAEAFLGGEWIPGPGLIQSRAWDVVSVQPYPGDNSTLLSDELMIRDVMDSTDAGTAFYILTGWPPVSGFDDIWLEDVLDDDETPTSHARAYFDVLAQRLSGSRKVVVIPVGEVLFQLGKRIDAGDVPDLSDLSELYRDDVHLTERGGWVAGVTAASVILGVDPLEFGKPGSPWYGELSIYSSEFVSVVRDVIAEVLASE